MACRLVALPSPASRPSTPRRAFSQPRAGLDTARRPPGSARFVPASAHRRADRPPSRHRPNRIRRVGGVAACSCGPLSRAQTRSGGAQPPCRPPISARSVAIRPSTRPWAVHVAASPDHRQSLKLPGQLPAPTRPRDPPAPPPRPPAQFPAGRPPAGIHMPARAAWRFSERKIRERETARRPRSVPWGGGREGDIGSRASASVFRRQGGAAGAADHGCWAMYDARNGVRGAAPGVRAGRCARGSIRAWS